MTFTDPPYGYEYQSNMREKSDKFEVLLNDDRILDFLPNVRRHCNGFVFVCTAWKVLEEGIAEFKRSFDLTNIVIWNKGGGGMGDLKHTFFTDYEVILVSNQGKEIQSKRIGSVWSIPKDNAADYVHATQKPVRLPSEAILHTTKPGDKVLDLFGGSGSTLLACEQTGRKGAIMEMDPRNVDIIVERWKQYTGKTPQLMEG